MVRPKHKLFGLQAAFGMIVVSLIWYLGIVYNLKPFHSWIINDSLKPFIAVYNFLIFLTIICIE